MLIKAEVNGDSITVAVDDQGRVRYETAPVTRAVHPVEECRVCDLREWWRKFALSVFGSDPARDRTAIEATLRRYLRQSARPGVSGRGEWVIDEMDAHDERHWAALHLIPKPSVLEDQ